MVPVLTVVASEFRSQQRNRAAARDRLAGLLREAIAPPSPPRRATYPRRRFYQPPSRQQATPCREQVPSAVAQRTNSPRHRHQINTGVSASAAACVRWPRRVKDGSMPEWSLLQDAYGPADRVPGLLARASAETDLVADVWGELWSRLCHQGTVYSASYAAIPWLAIMASGQPLAALVPPV